MVNTLINLSSLKALIATSTCTTLSASTASYGGFILQAHLDDGAESKDYTLATFTSSSPKVFKRAESLMKDAQTLGIHQVLFDFSNTEL